MPCWVGRRGLLEEETLNLKPVASCAKGRNYASGRGNYKCKGPEVGLNQTELIFESMMSGQRPRDLLNVM